MAKARQATIQGDNAGRNVFISVEGNVLVIRCDMSDTARDSATASKSGKNKVLGSTNGNVGIAGTDLKLGLNLYFANDE